jgi:hypothetical protein
MATAADLIRVAAGEVGYIEGPYNRTKYGAEMYGGKYQNQAWCGLFTDWCLQKVNMLQGEPSSVWTPSGAAGYQRANRWISRAGAAQAGDVVYFDWGGSQSVQQVDHVGFVEAVAGDYILTIEGNTSSSNAGSQSNGDGVYRRKRPRSVIVGFGRPQYSVTPVPPQPIDWAALRRLLAAMLLNEGFGSTGTVREGSGGRDVLLWHRRRWDRREPDSVVGGHGAPEHPGRTRLTWPRRRASHVARCGNKPPNLVVASPATSLASTSCWTRCRQTSGTRCWISSGVSRCCRTQRSLRSW